MMSHYRFFILWYCVWFHVKHYKTVLLWTSDGKTRLILESGLVNCKLQRIKLEVKKQNEFDDDIRWKFCPWWLAIHNCKTSRKEERDCHQIIKSRSVMEI